MNTRSSFEAFQKECPELAERFDNLVEVQRSLCGLDDKTKQLITLAIETAIRNSEGVRQHAALACRTGATREEIVGAVVMNLHLTGLVTVLDALPAALAGIDTETQRRKRRRKKA